MKKQYTSPEWQRTDFIAAAAMCNDGVLGLSLPVESTPVDGEDNEVDEF